MSGLVVAMFGLSGVGKGWLARQLCQRRPEILHLEASALMRDALQASSEALRTATNDVIDDNQSSLIAAFAAARTAAPSRPTLFDGHCVIDNDAGLVEIPLAVIARLEPSYIVFISDEPEAIADRRRGDDRKRPVRSLDELAHHQDRARLIALAYAEGLAIPFDEICAGDWKALDRVFDGAQSRDARHLFP
jgi:adenylate kinase